MEKNNGKEKVELKKMEEEREVCGIIMPISSIDGCSENHWKEVYGIISESIKDAGYKPNLVSYSDDVAVIQKNIVQNIYENSIIVCDVSAKNPNVMFELGMRLAFDKPTIIIKDDMTSYSFDTSPIEHLTYPRDLRFTRIVEFKKALTEKIKATMGKAKSDRHYSPFLGSFGKFTVAKIDSKEVSKDDYILEEIKELRKLILYKENKSVNSLNLVENGRQAKNHVFGSEKDLIELLATVDKVIKINYELLKEMSDRERHDFIINYIRKNEKVSILLLSSNSEDLERISSAITTKLFEHFVFR